MNIIQTNLKFKNTPQKRSSTKKIIVHHADATTCNMQMIDSWHKARGWSGAGYHFHVRKNGTVETGRPIDTIGAHCTGQNSDSIGICFEGNFEQETMSDLQLQTGRELIAYIKGIYGDIKVTKHKDFMATSCPGKNFPFNELIAKAKVKEEVKTDKATYTVRKGDTLSKIGKSLNVDWKDIATLNGIKPPYTLQIGQVLKVSNTTTKQTTTTKSTKTLKKGAKVKIKSGAVDLNTKKKYASFVYKTTYTVISISGNNVVFGLNGTATGKCDSKYVTLV